MALPTNANFPPLGSNAVGGVNNYTTNGVALGALQTICLGTGGSPGAGVTSGLLVAFAASFNFLIREVVLSSKDVTGTTTADVYNNTTTTAIIAATAITDAVPVRVTTIAAATVTEGDVLYFRITTAASTGEAIAPTAWLVIEPLLDTTSNPYP